MTCRSTIERAAVATGFKIHDLRGPERTTALCRARFAIMFAMRAHGLSLASIGHALHRHHTTVLSGLRRADDYAMSDTGFLELVERIG